MAVQRQGGRVSSICLSKHRVLNGIVYERATLEVGEAELVERWRRIGVLSFRPATGSRDAWDKNPHEQCVLLD